MFENWMHPFQSTHFSDHPGSENMYARRYNTALNQFRITLLKGKIFRWKSKFLNRSQRLYDLNALQPNLLVRGSFYSGVKVVSISSIIGSEGRTTDFDMDFHPLNEAARERWVSMAIAYLSHLSLAPVQLIQIGDAYFVRDGHHRISVGRAFGQIAIDAEVITWNASPPFPWQSCGYISGQTLLAQQP